MKYVVFGAGKNGKEFLEFAGEERVEYFVDNDEKKSGEVLGGKRVFSFDEKKQELYKERIVVSVRETYAADIIKQLNEANISGYVLAEKAKEEIIKDRISKRTDYINTYKKSIMWIKKHSLDTGGIVVTSDDLIGYPEVTGYFIPSLIMWGYRDIAASYAKWLINIQNENGSWNGPDNQPYVFDTGQILKGLIAVRSMLPEADSAIKKGCDWLISNIEETGRMKSVREDDFDDNRTFSELIHIYCLSPLMEASRLFDNHIYVDKARKALQYYINNSSDIILDFSYLSHFYAYIIEGLIDVGEIDIAKRAMNTINGFQNNDGSIPAYKDSHWICTTGLFQFSLIYYKLGDLERGNKAFEYACKLQNESGGWYGSVKHEHYSEEDNTYFPNSEISWANKYFLDALYWRMYVEFEKQHDLFKDSIEIGDGRYLAVKRVIERVLENKKRMKVLDIGCGKGAYIKNLVREFDGIEIYATDISDSVMSGIGLDRVAMSTGMLTNTCYEDGFFDVVYTCEALEHAIDIESALKELARITKSGGYIVIVDKNAEKTGKMIIEDWEQWFEIDWMEKELRKYCDGVYIDKNVEYEGNNDNLFCCWIGKRI